MGKKPLVLFLPLRQTGGMAGMIPPEVVEQIRHACDIVDVIGSYVPLKKSGAKFKALSPFNKEKTPSFYVDPAKQMFKCFSSGKGGDVFKFLMEHDNMSFPEAVRRLAQRAGIPVPEDGPAPDPAARGRKEELYALYAAVAKWWQQLLLHDPAAEPAREYLRSRDFPTELATEFGLGYAPEGWDTTLNWAHKQGYSAEALENAKLVATSESGRTYDFFRGRLMIPICDEANQVVAFSGRLLDPQAKAQKYVNSPETPIFIKSKILFGLNKTKRPIIEAESAILCEGQIDLMRCWQAGIRHIVAPQGTAFTEAHARILKRLAKEVVICFDADRAGQNAAERTVDILLQAGLNVRIARMPQGEDPDSLLRKQPVEVFAALLQEAPDYTRYLLDRACERADLTGPAGKGQVAREMAAVLGKIENGVQREVFLLEVARRLQVSRGILEEEVQKEAGKRHAQQAAKAAYQVQDFREEPPDLHGEGESGEIAPILAPLQPDLVIEALLSLLLVYPAGVPEVTRRLNPRWLEGIEGAAVLQQLLDTHAADAWQDEHQFLAEVDERTRDYLTGLLMEPIPLPNLEEVTLEQYAENLLSRLEKRWIQQQIEITEQKIKSGLCTSEELTRLFQELLAMKRAL